jgi:hypothetical protein
VKVAMLRSIEIRPVMKPRYSSGYHHAAMPNLRTRQIVHPLLDDKINRNGHMPAAALSRACLKWKATPQTGGRQADDRHRKTSKRSRPLCTGRCPRMTS